MKLKEFNLIDFLFYKYYRIAVGVKGRVPIFSGISAVTLLITLAISWSLFSIAEKYELGITFNRWHGFIICGICLSFISFYFYHGKRYQRIIDRYKTIGKKTEIFTDILAVVGYIVFIILLIIYVPKR